MKELMAELLECTCLQQGREALAEQIIEKHVARLFLAAPETSSVTAEQLEEVGRKVDAEEQADAGNSVSA